MATLGRDLNNSLCATVVDMLDLVEQTCSTMLFVSQIECNTIAE